MKKQEGFDDFLVSLGRTIRKHRKAARMTQEQLAEAIGSESEKDMRSYISKLENGHRNPPASVLKRICGILQISPAELLDEAEDMQMEVQLCSLFEQCYGKEAFRIVQHFLKLDPSDQQVVETMLTSMLSADKYKKDESSKKRIS